MWVPTLKFHDVWISAVFEDVTAWTRTILCAILMCFLLQLSLQLLHLQMEVDHN